ncbi:MAG: ATP-binding protein [Sulfurospirillum sp.]|nr:MAG: ATP-binding protein [Sulfurospirillum sp.]
MKTLLCATQDGIDAKPVDVEVAYVRGLPSFSIVGLAQTSIQESKERVKSALSSIDFKFPTQKVTVNLSPSDLKKEGSHFDLPIALLIALQNESVDFKDFIALGELGLDGTLKDTSSIYTLVLSLANAGKIKNIVIPKESLSKISNIPNINIYAPSNLKEAIELFKDPKSFPKHTPKIDIKAKTLKIDKEYYYHEEYPLDFLDVKGQESAKRASLIAAAGMHNILYEGSPGCGKSMCAKRVPYIMPPMSLEEILTNAKLQSLYKNEPTFEPKRIFRSPHRSSSASSIFGGGSKNAQIGEIALCGNGGVLFFDEFPYFGKSILESLRQPLEDHKLLISRVNSKIEYQAKFLFIAAMNPCPCGNLLSSNKNCRCSEVEINRYNNRLSAPVLDRIDLFVQMDETDPHDMPTISSKEMHMKVLSAFKMQKERGQTELNGKIDDKEIAKFCILDDESKEILDQSARRFGLSQRAINKILKVSRTIADLDSSQSIKKGHTLEALRFRMKK